MFSNIFFSENRAVYEFPGHRWQQNTAYSLCILVD